MLRNYIVKQSLILYVYSRNIQKTTSSELGFVISTDDRTVIVVDMSAYIGVLYAGSKKG